jgi:hypothetical protein
MGIGRNLFFSGVSWADQTESNRKETHGKILKPDFHQKFILILLCLMLVRDKIDMKGFEYRF